MLTESGYQTGLLVYALSALVALWLFNRWFLRRWFSGVRLLVLLPLAALLLTPAYTAPGGETMAPALVVAVFHTMTDGADAAAHALQPLTLLVGAALGLAVLLCLLLLLLTRHKR